MEALDPDSGRWLPAAGRMLSARKYCGAAPLNGRLYVCGGLRSAERQRLASVEAYDPREGVFREVCGGGFFYHPGGGGYGEGGRRGLRAAPGRGWSAARAPRSRPRYCQRARARLCKPEGTPP
jgi:hypothetical protein